MVRWICRIQNVVGDLVTACCEMLYPPRCVFCSADLSESERVWLLCRHCLAALGPEAWHGCRRCGCDVVSNPGLVGAGDCRNYRASENATVAIDAPDRCESCRNAALWFDTVVPLGDYDAGLRDAVLRMKHVSHDALTTTIGRLLAERRREHLAEAGADVIVPIPMFWRRRLRRGKNSPDTLAKCLGRSLGIPVRPSILVRCRNTSPQASLTPSRRFENVRGAFRVRRPASVTGTRVLLVDDVLTTGATCSEAAKTLKKAGATMVAVAVVARAQGRLQ
jgi:ComF family protein